MNSSLHEQTLKSYINKASNEPIYNRKRAKNACMHHASRIHDQRCGHVHQRVERTTVFYSVECPAQHYNESTDH